MHSAALNLLGIVPLPSTLPAGRQVGAAWESERTWPPGSRPLPLGIRWVTAPRDPCVSSEEPGAQAQRILKSNLGKWYRNTDGRYEPDEKGKAEFPFDVSAAKLNRKVAFPLEAAYPSSHGLKSTYRLQTSL